MVDLRLVDFDAAPDGAAAAATPAAVDVDLHVEHLRGEVEAAVDRGGHELEADLAPDRLQAFGHPVGGPEMRRDGEIVKLHPDVSHT